MENCERRSSALRDREDSARPCMKQRQASSSLTSPCPPECLIQISNCHENVGTPQLIGSDTKKRFFFVRGGWMRVCARGEIGSAEAREETCQRRPQPTRGARLAARLLLLYVCKKKKKKNEGRSFFFNRIRTCIIREQIHTQGRPNTGTL